MTYPEAIQFLYGLRLFGAKLGLQNTEALSRSFGHPQSRLRFIHVAGTNGKGSVCAMLESIYRAAGYRVGLFTSPHLVAFAERIQVNRRPIPEETVARLVGEFRAVLQSFPAGAHPTFFEVVTVMALRYFAEEQCDLVLWETGLGGRLDATNIVTPLVSVITNIGQDHQQWLGEEIGQIASEKAGIIKPGVPVLTAATQPEALAVLQAEAQRKHAPFFPVSEASKAASVLQSIRLPLAGIHQQWNAALAIAVTQALGQAVPITENHLRQGLEHVHWPGRLQTVTLDSGQVVLLDGAHNMAGFDMLVRHLETTGPKARLAVILGLLEDKDRHGIAKIIAPCCRRLCLVPVQSWRSAKPEALLPIFQQECRAVDLTAVASLAEAWKLLEKETQILITGSIYLVGEAMEFLGLSSVKPLDERCLNDWRSV